MSIRTEWLEWYAFVVVYFGSDLSNFETEVSLCRPGFPLTHDSFALVSLVLELQTCIIMPSLE